MAIVEVSAIYKADQDGFHLDDKANAIFKAHGGKWVDQNTTYGCGPMHLDHTITYQMEVEQVGAVKLALEQAGFRVTIQAYTIDDLMVMYDPDKDTQNLAIAEGFLGAILDQAIHFYDSTEDDIARFAMAIAFNITEAKEGVDKPIAEATLENIAKLAYMMLEKERTDNWGADIRARLERIRDTSDRFAEEHPTK